MASILSGSITNLGAIQSLILPHIKAVSGVEYKKQDKVYDVIFENKPTNMFYDEYTEIAPLGTFKVKAEGGETQRDGMKQSFKTKATQVDYALAHAITDKAIRFADHADLAIDAGKHVARAAHHSMEFLATNFLDNSRGTSTTADGAALVSTAHLLIDESNASNRLATDAAFSQPALHQLLILQRQLVDPRGMPMSVQAERLVVPNSKLIQAQEILATSYQLDTANNNKNVIVENRLIPGGVINLDYSSDANAFYLLANREDVPNGLLCNKSADLEVNSDVDESTRTINIFGFFSNVFFAHDWRQIVGTSGV